MVVRPPHLFHRRRFYSQDEVPLVVEDEGAVLVLPAAARADGQVAQRRPVSRRRHATTNASAAAARARMARMPLSDWQDLATRKRDAAAVQKRVALARACKIDERELCEMTR